MDSNRSRVLVAISFCDFALKVTCIPAASVQATVPLHGYGLTAAIERRFAFMPTPLWESFLSPDHEGEKHPASRQLTDRLLRLQQAVLSSVARKLDYGADYWPVVSTEMSAEGQEQLPKLHDVSDWVVTVDRNAGVEFFDSPQQSRAIYDAYLIDCVPERDDLGSLQLITSTTKADEVRDLLDATLAEMGLSSSLRNCEFLLEHLKALSGRLAIRLTSPATKSGELVALALVHASCAEQDDFQSPWAPGKQGFFVPLDDVRDLDPPRGATVVEGEEAVRADLLFVGLPNRGGLSLSFLEVKYRRHLRTAREPQLLERVTQQAESNGSRWLDWYFGENLPNVARALRRSRLVRALRFYADKAARHLLPTEIHHRILQELDKLLTQGADYRLSSAQNRGYIFCPAVTSPEPVLVSSPEDSTAIYLFGPAHLPDLSGNAKVPGPNPLDFTAGADVQEGSPEPQKTGRAEGGTPPPQASLQPSRLETGTADDIGTPPEIESDRPLPSNTVVHILLGEELPEGRSVVWDVSKDGNPHLMVVGLPGTGKTVSLINICRQLIQQQVVPIVFSYHQDIDAKLEVQLERVDLFDPSQLGFNPMQIVHPAPTSFIDNAGELRDIFAAIFPDLGDIQLDRIRQAIKRSYQESGWNAAQPPGGASNDAGQNGPGSIPEFRAFFRMLQEEAKPDRGLLARLSELDDYGVFAAAGSARSLLSAQYPTVLRIHTTQNDKVQRAFAILALYNVYKEMFRRGSQERITHAVIFDEAHRATRLRLLPTMAKECRKYGLVMIVASQEAKDFDSSLFSAIANYLLLHMTEKDARALARNVTTSNMERRIVDRLKTLDKYQALFFREGRQRPSYITLSPP
jgi:DNA phosphorothioation-dependent restriction protein DptH